AGPHALPLRPPAARPVRTTGGTPMTRRAPLLAIAALLLGFSSAAQAAGGADYLAGRLTRSGGFVEAGSSTPSVSLTEWAVMGLTAAGRHPGRMHRTDGRTPAAYLTRR